MKATLTLLAVCGAAVLLAFAFPPSPSTSHGTEAVAWNNPVSEMPRRVAAKDGERQGLSARLALREHGRHQTGTHIYSIYSFSVEIENLSYSEMALVEFDPHDLQLELLDAKGEVIAPGPQEQSGPIRRAHQVVIPVDSYVGLSAYDQGMGVSGRIQLNAGTVWHPLPGEYQVRGTVAVTVSYSRPQLEGTHGNLVKSPQDWDGEPQRVELQLPLSRFTLRATD